MLRLILSSALLISTQAHAHLNESAILAQALNVAEKTVQEAHCEQALLPDMSNFIANRSQLDPAKTYFTSSAGRHMRYITYTRNEAAIRQSDFLHITIHGLGDRAESFENYHKQWATAGYTSVGIGLHGSDLDLLKAEMEASKQFLTGDAAARGRLRAVYIFEQQVNDVVEFVMSQGPRNVAITSHSAGTPIAMAVAKELKLRGVEPAVIFGGGYLNFRTSVEKAINAKAFMKMGKEALMDPTKLKERLEGMVKFFLTHKLREHFEAISRRLPRPLTKAETDMLGDGAAALARGLKPVDLMDKSDPLEIRKTLEGSSVLILHGDKDKVIHASATRRFHRELTAAGVLSEHRIIELGEGLEHDLFEVSSPKTFPIAHDFFVRSFSGSKNLKQLRRFFNWDIFRRKADVATGESAG